MPLGLGLGLGIGKGNIYPPASAWPTVADIPPGALVLDSDGVVKQKVGDSLVPVPFTIIGSGPIASAPVASAAYAGMYYMSSEFGACVCRSVASDYVGAYASLSTAPCLHNVNWSVSFAVNANTVTNSYLYGEGDIATTTTLLGIGAGAHNAKKLRVFLRDSTSAIVIDITTTSDVLDGLWHYVTVVRSGSTLIFTIDGVAEAFTGLRAIAINSTPNTSSIGALRRTTVTNDFTGLICNFKKCNGLLIPLNETSGTTVKDSAGTTVGTVTAPGSPWWAYSWVPTSALQ